MKKKKKKKETNGGMWKEKQDRKMITNVLNYVGGAVL